MNQIVREKGVTTAGKILDELHTEIMTALRQEAKNPRSNQDGMDMAICVVDEKKKELEFAGAMNPLFLVKGGEIEVVPGDKVGIGGTIASRKMKKMDGFTSRKLKYEEGVTIYLFSDGYMDQFGGTNNEKFNQDRFKEMLVEITSLSMAEQGKKVESEFENWKGKTKQLDDVLLLGIRLS